MRTFLGLVVFILVLGGAGWLVYQKTPPQHAFWRPLSLDHPIGMATGTKLRALKGRPFTCFAVLDEAGIDYTRLPDGDPEDPCGFQDALTLDRSRVPYSATLQLSCPLAAALLVWERQSALPYAEELLGSPVARIETYGSYSCRRLYGREEGRYSQHARANAVDISGVVLSDGRRITVLDDYGKETDEAAYLDQVHEDACEVFAIVLGPDYNRAHRDHFHMDMSGGGLCR